MMLALLLLQAVPAAAAPAPVEAPAWKVNDRTNAGGIRSVSASLVARDARSRFVVKCDLGDEPVVSLQFLQPSPLGATAAKVVKVRFDGGPAFAYNWQFPGSGTYISDPAAVTTLTGFLVKAKDLGIETTNESGFAVQAMFAVPPAAAVVRQVLGACGYTLGVVPAPLPAKPAQ